jgi:hypothetical protein
MWKEIIAASFIYPLDLFNLKMCKSQMYVVNCYDGIFRRLQTSVEQSDY